MIELIRTTDEVLFCRNSILEHELQSIHKFKYKITISKHNGKARGTEHITKWSKTDKI